MWEILSKLTMKILERRNERRSSIFIVNFQHISHFFQILLLLTVQKFKVQNAFYSSK